MNKLEDFILNNKVFSKCNEEEQKEIIEELERIKSLDKAFDLFIEWATDCDFGYDNLGDLYEKYEKEIEDLSYSDGLKYIALKEAKM